MKKIEYNKIKIISIKQNNLALIIFLFTVFYLH